MYFYWSDGFGVSHLIFTFEDVLEPLKGIQIGELSLCIYLLHREMTFCWPKVFLERKCQFGDWNVSLVKLFICTKGGRNKHPNFKAAEPFLSTSSGVPQVYFKILQVQFASFKGWESKCSDWTKCLPHPQTFFFSRMGIKLKFYYSPCSGCLQHLGKLEAELAKVKSVYAEKVLHLYLISQQLDPLRIL